MKISFFQYLPEFNNLQENIANIVSLIQKNKENILKTDILVFPEYSFSGPLNLDNFENYKKQITDMSVISILEKISKELKGVTIIFGSMILPMKNKTFANTSMVFKNGKIVGTYDKKALIYNENYICTASKKYLKFNVGKYKIGLAICWDLILPEVFRNYVNEIDLIIIPSFWGIGGNLLQSKYKFSLEKKYYRQLCVSRAYENAFALLFVNSVGEYKSSFYTDRMMGGSLAIMPPLGEVYFSNDKNPNNIHIIEMDFKFLKEYREYYATDKDFKYYKSKNIF